MSVEIMGKVWGMDLSLPELTVLLAMADHADHEGRHIYPSLGLIGWKVGLSERQTRRIVKALTAAKILVPQKVKPGYPTEYAIDIDAAKLKPPMVSALTTERRAQLLDLLIQRDGLRCQYCDHEGTPEFGPDGNVWNLDRVNPGAHGGRYEPDNLVLSCATCNRKKGPNKRKRHHTPVTHDTPVKLTPLSPMTPVTGDTPVMEGQTPRSPMTPKPSLEPSLNTPPISPSKKLTPGWLVGKWNEICAPAGLPRKIKLTDELSKKIKLRLVTYSDEEFWLTVLRKIATTPFYRGENDRQWQADLDWLVKNDATPQRIFERRSPAPRESRLVE